MSIRIDAPKIKVSRKESPLVLESGRFVRESDWRKIMAVVKAVDRYWPDATFCAAPDEIYFPLSALRKHLEKRK